MMYTKINIYVNGGILVGEILIKGVGKKITIGTDRIKVSKTIGKDIEIPLDNISSINYEKGTMSKNGNINIEWTNGEGSKLKESMMFRCFSNDIVEEATNGILKYLEDPNKTLVINEKEKIGVFQQINREGREQAIEKLEQKQKDKERLADLKKQGIPYCPKCNSTSLTTTNKKLSIGRAVVGGSLFGGAGAVLGGLTSKKIELVCMNCGHKFKPSKK